jgi:septal ring factor EnvC (AmiA/AmiB activator)
VSEKLFKKLAVSTLLLLLTPVLTLLGLNGRIKALEEQLAQTREERDQAKADAFNAQQSVDFWKDRGTYHEARHREARVLLEEVVDVTSVSFSEYGEQMLHSETALHEAQRAERIAKLMRAIRAFLVQQKAEGEA